MSSTETESGHFSKSPVLALLTQLMHASATELPFLKVQAKQVHDDLLRLSDNVRSHGADAAVQRSAYDAWVVELFLATESAVPREALLRDFARRFAQMHSTHRLYEGPRIVVLQYLAAQGGAPARITGFYQQGINSDQWRRFQEQLAQHQGDPALHHLFVQRNRFEKDYLPYAQQAGLYSGVFDAALGRAKGNSKEDWAAYGPNAWISAQPLFGSDAREGHAVVMLYPNEGRYFEYREPAKSGQDLRLLDVLSAVYRQLDQQVKNLAVQVLRAREQMLAHLGPAVMHHEVGGIARHVQGLVHDGLQDWAKYEEVYEPPPMLLHMGQRLHRVHEDLGKIITTAEGFMNMERRGSVREFDLASVLAQVERMVIVRCGSMGAKLSYDALLATPDSPQTPKRLRNDATLVMHALLNMVNNALDAMQERYAAWQVARAQARKNRQPLPDGWPSRIEIRWTLKVLPPGCVGWDVVNTGPTIDPHVQPRVFERGFSTRAQGHGQGLHLVRMTAQYCGGDVALLPHEALNTEAQETVGFVYWIAKEHSVDKELSL